MRGDAEVKAALRAAFGSAALRARRGRPMVPLLRNAKNVYSQNGEDGLIDAILLALRIQSGWVVEFGAWDGRHLSNTYRLVRDKKFHGVFIEGDAARFRELEQTANETHRIIPLHAFVAAEGPNSLDVLLSSTPCPKDLEVLSIDVDGPDYFIWQGCRDYRPKIVVIEVNSFLAPPWDHTHNREAPMSSYWSTVRLGEEKGYFPLAHTGNVVFARNDLRASIEAVFGPTPDAMSLFDPRYVRRLLANRGADYVITERSNY